MLKERKNYGVNIRVTETMRRDLNLLAMKDRRTPSQILLFAAEAYLIGREAEIKSLRAAQAETKVDPAAKIGDYFEAVAERSSLIKGIKS